MNNIFLCLIFILLAISCTPVKKIHLPERKISITGTEFYKQASAMKWKERDSLAVKEILEGGLPDFLKKFVPVKIYGIDSSTGKIVHLTYYVAPDYLSIGNNNDWARINITPMAAQKIADSLNCFLPTRVLWLSVMRCLEKSFVKLE